MIRQSAPSKPATDIAAGLEPLPIPLCIGNHTPPIFKYITDSILPGGAQLSSIPPPRVQTAVDQDEDDSDSDEYAGGEAWSCGCSAGPTACTVIAGDDCDCVSNFGNFYASSAEGRQVLLLDSLPARLPLVECSPECGCLGECGNRLTQTGIRVPLVVRYSQTGFGAYFDGNDALPAGSFISLYAGEYLTTNQARERWKHHQGDNYILSLRLPDQTIHIDPRHYGNFGRFLNHSCDPNCIIHVVRWGGGLTWPRAAIFTKRAVLPGEELTFDYGNASGAEVGNVAVGEDKETSLGQTKCLCGSAQCRGWMPFDESL